MKTRIEKSRARRLIPNIDGAFLYDEIRKNESIWVLKLRRDYPTKTGIPIPIILRPRSILPIPSLNWWKIVLIFEARLQRRLRKLKDGIISADTYESNMHVCA